MGYSFGYVKSFTLAQPSVWTFGISIGYLVRPMFYRCFYSPLHTTT